MLMAPDALQALIQADPVLDAYVLERRRALHRCPELSGQEVETRATLCSELTALGIEFQALPPACGCAVVGLIRGALPGPTVALRADMDALPVDEPQGLPFRSQKPGIMHACGHDAHMAIQLGAARLLAARRDALPGNIKLLFEPAEETTGGAQGMIEAGCLEQPRVDAVLGLHMSPKRPCGHLSTRPGPASGSSDEIRLTLRGRAGHGAYPERGVDAIVIAAQVVTALQTLVSRETSPLDNAVLSLCTIAGGTATNIVCDCVTVGGTLRTVRADTRERLKRRIAEVTALTAQALGGLGEAELIPGYGAVINDPALTGHALELARAVLGPDCVHIDEHPSLGVESFSYFVQSTPGVYYDIGCGLGPPLHARDFFVDEACLPAATRMQAALAWETLLHLA